MSEALFQPGQMIFREGDTTQEAYRILKGRVEISIAGEGKSVILAQLGEGDIFGEMAMVDMDQLEDRLKRMSEKDRKYLEYLLDQHAVLIKSKGSHT